MYNDGIENLICVFGGQMGKDIYKKGLILLGVIVVAVITYFGYMMQSKNANNIQPYDESELKKSDEELNDKEDQENLDQEEKVEEAARIFIDISGAVKNPGIYELNEGARLNDAIEASGGLTEDANSDYIAKSLNKARVLNDEEKIYIPFEKDDISLIENNTTDDSKNTSSTNAKASNGIDNAKININTATKEQLTTLKGIGDSYAQRIIDYRQEKKFTKIEDIKNIKGIGEKTFENIKDKITVK
jgi:competence protein ComEA